MLGMLYASVFITVVMIMMFMSRRDKAASGQPLNERFSPMAVAMTIVAMSYPTWAVVGGALGALYGVSAAEAPGGGLGSPNRMYTMFVAGAALMLALPLALLMRRALKGTLALVAVFIALFGWFLPYFVA